jgi:hypothetical protein
MKVKSKLLIRLFIAEFVRGDVYQVKFIRRKCRSVATMDFQGASLNIFCDCEVVSVHAKPHAVTLRHYVFGLYFQYDSFILFLSILKMHEDFSFLVTTVHQRLFHTFPSTSIKFTDCKILHLTDLLFSFTFQDRNHQVLFGCMWAGLLSNFMAMGKVFGSCL